MVLHKPIANSDRLRALEHIAYLHLRYGNPRRADAYYRFLLQFDEPSARMCCAAALARCALGLLDEALLLTDEGLKIPAEDSIRGTIWLVRSRIFAARGSSEEAATALEQFFRERNLSR